MNLLTNQDGVTLQPNETRQRQIRMEATEANLSKTPPLRRAEVTRQRGVAPERDAWLAPRDYARL